MLKQHRICFLLYNGYLPEFVDHINGIKRDNAKINLREATNAENITNTGIISTNTSGIKGVYYQISSWMYQVSHKGKKYRKGGFSTKEEAHEALKILREELHGDFTNHG